MRLIRFLISIMCSCGNQRVETIMLIIQSLSCWLLLSVDLSKKLERCDWIRISVAQLLWWILASCCENTEIKIHKYLKLYFGLSESSAPGYWHLNYTYKRYLVLKTDINITKWVKHHKQNSKNGALFCICHMLVKKYL